MLTAIMVGTKTSARDRTTAVRHDLRSIVDMSRAVSTPASLPSILSRIAGASSELLEAEAAIILLVDAHDRLRVTGEYGVSAGYRHNFDADQSRMPVMAA